MTCRIIYIFSCWWIAHNKIPQGVHALSGWMQARHCLTLQAVLDKSQTCDTQMASHKFTSLTLQAKKKKITCQTS
uniref:Uncharacterized protein n=1 Tax=Ixodes ricinus TaxID=34613 RepID=A0A6B0U4Y1_IXORI